jgi:hypothetical protein
MNPRDMASQRLAQQLLTQGALDRPEDVVGWLGAVQAQEYAGAKWGIGLRTRGLSDGLLDRSFDEGRLLRTHLLRPTWHFVTPADIRWLLALTGPRVHAHNAHRYRELGLEASTLARSHDVLAAALAGGRWLTRPELAAVLEGAGLSAEGQRMPYLLMHAELEGVICSGPRRGKQFTYALLDERVPAAPVLDQDAALAELARRYLRTRGPATVHDFAWWSGLTVTAIRQGIESLGGEVASFAFAGRTYWFVPQERPPGLAGEPRAPVVHLLPNYDEYFIGLADRDPITVATGLSEREARVPHAFANMLLVDGLIVGSWRRTLERDRILVEVRWGIVPTGAQRDAVNLAAARYGEFLGLPVTVSFDGEISSTK